MTADGNRPVRAAIATAGYLLMLCSFAVRAAEELPRVLIIATGGTIAWESGGPARSGAELLGTLPAGALSAEVTVEEFSRIGSSAMTPALWLRLAKRINRAFMESSDLSGIVVTHGTDTLEETAYFLSLVISDTRPVVVTGAMRNTDEVSADGPRNLINAIRVVTAKESAGAGVVVALNEEIHAPRDVTKVHQTRVGAFKSVRGGPIGIVDSDGVEYYRTAEVHSSEYAPFALADIEALPEVLLVSDFPGLFLRADQLLTPGTEGVVIAGFGGGRLSPGARRFAGDAASRGVTVVIASRVLGGRIGGDPLDGIDGAVARDLSPGKARILLMAALCDKRDPQRLRDVFASN